MKQNKRDVCALPFDSVARFLCAERTAICSENLARMKGTHHLLVHRGGIVFYYFGSRTNVIAISSIVELSRLSTKIIYFERLLSIFMIVARVSR